MAQGGAGTCGTWKRPSSPWGRGQGGFQGLEQAGDFQTEGWGVTVRGGEGGALGDSSGSVWSGAGSLCGEEALTPGPDHTGSRKPC